MGAAAVESVAEAAVRRLVSKALCQRGVAVS